MAKKKTILFYSYDKPHSLYQPLLRELSKKHSLHFKIIKKIVNPLYIKKLSRFFKIRFFYHKFLRKYLNFFKLSYDSKSSQNYDLVYASNIIPRFNCNYIVDLEIITALSGYNYHGLNKKQIKNELEKSNCKKIICWNESSYLTLTKIIDCSNFLDKIKIIPFGYKSTKILKRKNKNINFLFVSSVNNPQDFELKGGLITLEAFSNISKIYPDSKLYVRSNISKKIKEKYKSNKNIVFIEGFLSNKKMKDLFLKCDILLEPIPGINLMLECMNYKIPIIAFDYWIIPEFVIDKKTGLLVDSTNLFGRPNQTENYLKNHHLNYLKLLDPSDCHKYIKPFTKKAIFLIKNKNRLLKMGNYAKKMVEYPGKYSSKSYIEKISNLVQSSLS